MRNLALYVMVLLLSALRADGQEMTPETRVFREVGDIRLSLSIFRQAEGSPQKPAIVFFFGGGWSKGTPEQFRPQAIHFAHRGMVAITADYRVASRHNTTPFDAMEDAHAAMIWVRAHAREFGIDINRIAAAGGSSGGQLAASTATGEPSLADALILYNPALDTTGAKVAGAFRGRGAEASQMTRIHRSLPPTLILHGEADHVVPFEDSRRFCTAMQAVGNRCELVGYPGQEHGFFNARGSDTAFQDQTTKAADSFLTSLGWLQPGDLGRR